MKPKGKLLALFVVFGAIALVTASGAFTSTSVDRTMTVGVANDSSALLGLSPNGTSQNGGYASFSGDQIQVDVSNANLDADTHIDHVLVLQNNGNSDVEIWATLTGSNTGLVTLYSGPVSGGTAVPTSQQATITLSPGESASVSIEIDTTGAGLSAGDQIVDTVTFHAATA